MVCDTREKEPLSDTEFDRILAAATRMGDEEQKIILLLRWTGMHVSILADPIKYDLHMETEDGEDYISWKRTKKSGKDAYTSIKTHRSIDFDVEAYIKELRRRRQASHRRRISRQYFYQRVKTIGERAGITGLSPMSFRHTFGVWMLNAGADREFVRQKLNCSDRTLRTYLKYARKVEKPMYDKMGW